MLLLIENPRFALSWLYLPICDLADISFDVDFDQCMFGLAPPHVCGSQFQPQPTSLKLSLPKSQAVIQPSQHDFTFTSPSCVRVKEPIRTRANLTSLKVFARKCDGRHAHSPCYGSVKTDSGWQSVARAAGAYHPCLCKPWAAAVAKGLNNPDCPAGRQQAASEKPESFK